MDDIVQRAMTKWPDVPAAFGWLSLDPRGQWRIRGERIANALVNGFIGRNYAADQLGRWFFQNGPQRVFVELAYAPWVLQLAGEGELFTHNGHRVRRLERAWIDREGVVVLETEHGAATVDDRDVEAFVARFRGADGTIPKEDDLIEATECIQSGRMCDLLVPYAESIVPIFPITSNEVPHLLGFVRDPHSVPLDRPTS